MAFDRNERGKDFTLLVNGQQIPITNFDFDGNYDVSSASWNDQEYAEKTFIEKDVSGTFEWVGSNTAARDAVLDGNGNPVKGHIQGQTENESIRVRGVIVTTYSRGFPGGDTSDGTIDFEGEQFIAVR